VGGFCEVRAREGGGMGIMAGTYFPNQQGLAAGLSCEWIRTDGQMDEDDGRWVVRDLDAL
jgi:hypothetical protein